MNTERLNTLSVRLVLGEDGVGEDGGTGIFVRKASGYSLG